MGLGVVVVDRVRIMGVWFPLARMAVMSEEPRVGLVPPAMAIFILCLG